jgi:hypothetical protein
MISHKNLMIGYENLRVITRIITGDNMKIKNDHESIMDDHENIEGLFNIIII